MHLARRCRRRIASGAAPRPDGCQKCSKRSILGIVDGVQGLLVEDVGLSDRQMQQCPASLSKARLRLRSRCVERRLQHHEHIFRHSWITMLASVGPGPRPMSRRVQLAPWSQRRPSRRRGDHHTPQLWPVPLAAGVALLAAAFTAGVIYLSLGAIVVSPDATVTERLEAGRTTITADRRRVYWPECMRTADSAWLRAMVDAPTKSSSPPATPLPQSSSATKRPRFVWPAPTRSPASLTTGRTNGKPASTCSAPTYACPMTPTPQHPSTEQMNGRSAASSSGSSVTIFARIFQPRSGGMPTSASNARSSTPGT